MGIAGQMGRIGMSLGMILVIGCGFGAGEGAAYPDGVSVGGHGDVFRNVSWTRYEHIPGGFRLNMALPCPLSVQAEGKEFGPTEFASPASMQAAGAVIDVQQRLNRQFATVGRARRYLTVTWDGQGQLLGVNVNAGDPDGPGVPPLILRMFRRSATLPLSRAQLIEAFGPPDSFSRPG